jgi:ferrous iron transport protein B
MTIALAGQPNVGKSTVFNMLTGLNQHVGNWPGKTVEKKAGVFHYGQAAIDVIDLPGTFSLTAESEEERIARDFIIRERPDVVVVIVNAASLERGLYLVAELLALPSPLVIGLNMTDVAERQGIHVSPTILEAALGIPVCPMIASRNVGVRELIARAIAEANTASDPDQRGLFVGDEHRPVLRAVLELIGGRVPEPYSEAWVGMKLLEGDAEITALMQESAAADWGPINALLHEHEDAYLDIARARYEWISRIVRAAVEKPRAGQVTRTEIIDRVATHPVHGVVLLLAVVGLIFWLTYTLGTPAVSWLDQAIVGPAADLARAILPANPPWLRSLVAEGMIGGVGTVLTFVPILVIFFVALGVLEDVGYLARAAYVMDRFMHPMGLHGRSFMPLFLGFGCNVPAVMGCRIIENRRLRLLTILLAPFVPCTARLAVVAFLTPAFFGGNSTLVSWGLVSLNLLVLIVVGLAVHRLVFKGTHLAFIMEMPLYHTPNLRSVVAFVRHNTWEFVKKAGTIILVFSIAVWFLSRVPTGDLQTSLLADVGKALTPVSRWIGTNDWRINVALLTSFVAKENTIATLGVLFGGEGSSGGLAARVAGILSPGAALSFLVVQMLFIPCLPTIAAIRSESRSWRWAALSLGLMLVISFVMGAAVYHAYGWLVT